MMMVAADAGWELRGWSTMVMMEMVCGDVKVVMWRRWTWISR